MTAPSPYAAPSSSSSTDSSSADETVILQITDDEVPQDGLAVELAKAAPRRWFSKATLPLAAAVLVAGAFLGGVLTERNTGSGQQAAGNLPAGGFPTGGFPGGGGLGQPGGAGAPAGGGAATTAPATAGGTAATTGKVKLVQGSTIYVETADGTVITVKTGKDTSVRTSKTAKLSDIKAGAEVTVQGTTAGDDTVTATAVTKQ